MKLSIPNAVSSRVARQILVGQKHSPAILFGVGVVGAVASTVLACRATLKVEGVLVDLQKDVTTAKEVAGLARADYTDKDLKKDLAFLYVRATVKLAKSYAPAVGLGVLSIAALTGSHHILNKRNAALTAAYAAIEKGFFDYRRRVVDELGEDKDREFRYGVEEREIITETKQGPKIETVKRAGREVSGYARFFDETCSSWQPQSEYNKIFLRSQQNYANDMLRARGHVTLNEVYDMLGLERSKAGFVVGWVLNKGGDNYVDFGIFEGNDRSVRDFVNGHERSILLDFNVDGVIYDKV